MTSVLQPCGGGIIRTLKAHFRHRICRSILDHLDETEPQVTEQILPEESLLDGTLMLNHGWFDVKPECIRNCWRRVALTRTQEEYQFCCRMMIGTEGWILMRIFQLSSLWKMRVLLLISKDKWRVEQKKKLRKRKRFYQSQFKKQEKLWKH